MVRGGHADDPRQIETRPAIVHHRFGSLKGIPFAALAFEKRETDIDPLQGVPFHQAANSNRHPVRFQFDEVKPETEPLVTRQNFLSQVGGRVIGCPQAAIANESVEIRLVH